MQRDDTEMHTIGKHGQFQQSILELKTAKFVDGGRDPKTGLDCWGCVMVAMRLFGNEVPDFQISCFNSETINVEFRCKGTKWVSHDKPASGFLVAMRTNEKMPEMVNHYGVCLDDRYFLHIMQKARVMVTRFDHRYFKLKIEGFYEWIG